MRATTLTVSACIFASLVFGCSSSNRDKAEPAPSAAASVAIASTASPSRAAQPGNAVPQDVIDDALSRQSYHVAAPCLPLSEGGEWSAGAVSVQGKLLTPDASGNPALIVFFGKPGAWNAGRPANEDNARAQQVAEFLLKHGLVETPVKLDGANYPWYYNGYQNQRWTNGPSPLKDYMLEMYRYTPEFLSDLESNICPLQAGHNVLGAIDPPVTRVFMDNVVRKTIDIHYTYSYLPKRPGTWQSDPALPAALGAQSTSDSWRVTDQGGTWYAVLRDSSGVHNRIDTNVVLGRDEDDAANAGASTVSTSDAVASTTTSNQVSAPELNQDTPPLPGALSQSQSANQSTNARKEDLHNLAAGQTSTIQAATATPDQTEQDRKCALVQTYYADWNHRDFRGMYALLSEAAHKYQSYDVWLAALPKATLVVATVQCPPLNEYQVQADQKVFLSDRAVTHTTGYWVISTGNNGDLRLDALMPESVTHE